MTPLYSECYIFDNIDDFSSEWYECALNFVSDKRRIKSLSFVNSLDKKLSIIAELLLICALRDKGIHELPEISYNPFGKPIFRKLPSLHFNISHSKKSVAVVIGDTPIGVDIESMDVFSTDLAAMTMNKLEYANICSATLREREFSRLWTMKESYLKYLGYGLCDDIQNILNGVQGVNFQTTYQSEYVCTVCTDDMHICKPPIMLSLKSLIC